MVWAMVPGHRLAEVAAAMYRNEIHEIGRVGKAGSLLEPISEQEKQKLFRV
jgi:hypothetical protein